MSLPDDTGDMVDDWPLSVLVCTVYVVGVPDFCADNGLEPI